MTEQQENSMRWVAISGSWRATSSQVEQDVRAAVREIITSGNGIVAGGALNVDYFATDEAMKLDPTCKQIKVFLPTSLEIYAAHYRKRAQEGVITPKQAEILVDQLTRLQNSNPAALIGNPHNKIVDLKIYFERNSEVVNASDELLAFQVNKSGGVQDTVDKAKYKGIPVKIFEYTI